MAFIPVPDTAELVSTFSYGSGNQVKNVYNFREAGLLTWSPALLQALIAVYVSWETNTARALRSQNVTLTNVLARDISVANSYVEEQAQNIAGTVVSSALPANVTFAVKGVTGLSGRSFRARKYWCGLANNQVTGDLIVTATGNSIAAAMETMRTSFAAAQFVNVVVSRYANGVPRAVGVATDIVQWQLHDYRLDTQRRRLVGNE